MGTMGRLRNLTPWFIITVGGLFVLFMVLSDANITRIFTQRSNNVGSVNGEPISYKDFSQYVERARESQVKQTGKDIDESQMGAFRDEVWNAIVDQTLIQQKIKQYGIVVTNQEIKNALLGPNPPASIARYFRDSTGHFDRRAYEAAIFNPKNKEAMIQAEQMVRQQKLQQKLQSYISASVTISEDEIKQDFINQNIKMTAKYALVDISTIPDSSITITDKRLRKYYESHLNNYKIFAQRQIKYVLFKKQASHDDSVGIKKDLTALVKRLKADTSSFESNTKIYSDEPFSKDTVSINQIPVRAANVLLRARVGSIVGPVLTYEGYIVYRLINRLKTKQNFVRASHILIQFNGNQKKAKAEAEKIYKELKNGADFAKLAKLKSQDPSSAKRGGDLGWFGRGQMVKAFERAAFSGRIGRVLKPVKTQFGYHIIKVTGRTNKKFVIEKIINKIVPSGTTIDQLYSNAGDFSYLANKNNFKDEADLMKYKIIESPPFRKDAATIPGLGTSKALTMFAFNNDIGDVSKAYKVPAGYVVAMVSNIIKPGFKPFDKVKNSLKYPVTLELKRDKAMKIAAKIRKSIGDSGNFSGVFKVYPKVIVNTAANFTAISSIPGLGKEFAFSERALTLPLNKISEPIRGIRGAYLIKVLQRTKFDSTSYAIQHNTLRDELLQKIKSRLFTEWINSLKKNADIVDNRYLFYR